MNSQTIRVEMIGELIDLVRNCSIYKKTSETDQLILKVLTLPDDTNDQILDSISQIKAENRKIVPYVHSSPNSAYALSDLIPDNCAAEDEIVRTMKVSLLKGLQEIASNVYEPGSRKEMDSEIIDFIHKGISQCSLDATASSLYTTVNEMNLFIDRSRTLKFDSCL